MREPLSKKELHQEIKDSIDNLDSFLVDVVENKKTARIKPLSVELRKLLQPKGNGNYLLKRAESILGIVLVFPDKSTTLPPKTVEVGLDEYIGRLIFSLGGTRVTRLELIKLVADQKGAHIDERPNVLHNQSKGVVLPLGNPARDKLFFEQNHMYLISIAKTVSKVVREQILKEIKHD